MPSGKRKKKKTTTSRSRSPSPSSPVSAALRDQRRAARRVRPERDAGDRVGGAYQVSHLPEWQHSIPLEEEDWRADGSRLNTEDVRGLMAHNFFEESKGRLMDRILRFLEVHPKPTVKGKKALDEAAEWQGLKGYVRAIGDKWYVRFG